MRRGRPPDASGDVQVRDLGTFHAVAWAWWAVAALVVVHLAPNPTYVALTVAIALLVAESHRREGPFAGVFPVLVAVAALFVLVRVALTALTTSTGARDVIATLPALTLPDILGGFTIGGTVHATVVLHAAVEGFIIVGVISVFAAFNAVVSHHELIRSAPRAFHEVGLVVTVSLAFVPATMTAVRDVREADRARTGGRAVRRGRLLRTVVPILESGMERAVHLAESMDARGFAHGGPGPHEVRAGWITLGALGALAAAFAALVGRAAGVALALGAIGAALLVLGIRVASAADPRPRHRPRRLAREDLVMLTAVSLAPIGLGVLASVGEPSLRWRVAETALPGFDPLVALVIGVLAAPAVATRRRVGRAGAVRVAEHGEAET